MFSILFGLFLPLALTAHPRPLVSYSMRSGMTNERSGVRNERTTNQVLQPLCCFLFLLCSFALNWRMNRGKWNRKKRTLCSFSIKAKTKESVCGWCFVFLFVVGWFVLSLQHNQQQRKPKEETLIWYPRLAEYPYILPLICTV